METLTVKSPADLLSFIGHTLGFWPRQSLVCVTLDTNRIGATLRMDLPKHDGAERTYARAVADYLSNDANATSVLFAIYTSSPWEPGQGKPGAAIIAALTGELAARGLPIRDGLLVGEDTFSRYDDGPESYAAIPLKTTQSSQINAEYVYRGSTIHPSGRITLPAPTHEAAKADAVGQRMQTIRTLPHDKAIDQAHALWTGMLDTKNYPTDDQTVSLIANFQFAAIRDQLMAAIPGIDEPMDQILLAQTHTKPQWSRIEWAQQLLIRAYTMTSNVHAAPILTAIGYINWWEGRGSKAHQFLQLALEADPNYHLARLSEQMLSYGMIAPWNTDRNTAYRPRGLEAP